MAAEVSRAMVSVLDSEAHFERKAKEAGITDPNVTVLKNRGFKTLSQVAYMVSLPEADFATFCSTHFASFFIGEISSLRLSLNDVRLAYLLIPVSFARNDFWECIWPKWLKPFGSTIICHSFSSTASAISRTLPLRRVLTAVQFGDM